MIASRKRRKRAFIAMRVFAYITLTPCVRTHTSSHASANPGTIRFANYYGDFMVLQQGTPVVWGYIPTADCSEKVTVEMAGKSTEAKMVPSNCKFE